MKSKLCLIVILVVASNMVGIDSFGQLTTPSYFSRSEAPRTYIGVGLGVNSVGVIGLTGEQNLGKISIVGTAGIGSWGYKLSGGGRYYFSYPFGKGIGVSYGLATGLSKVELNLETISGTKQNVNVQLSPVQLLNLTYFNCWKLGNKSSRFGLELGYSILMSSGDNFKIIDNGVVLSNTSMKVLRVLQPGGLLLGVSFTFGG